MQATVLFVDDNPNITSLAAEAIRELRPQWKTLAANSLDEARKLYRQTPPHATVLDYKLNDGNGFELLTELRKQDPRLPVVMTSGHQREVIDQAGREFSQQPYAFFEKPFSFENLVEILEREINSACLVQRPAGKNQGDKTVPASTRALARRTSPWFWTGAGRSREVEA